MKSKLIITAVITAFIVTIIAVFYLQFSTSHEIKVGILFSKTGTMAESEAPVIKAILLAIEQINQNGGINGNKIIPIVYDPQSNWAKYGELAKKMITENNVKVIFGCWTSASRKEVKPIVEQYDSLLIYPTQYEGVEESNNIIYLGAAPNQQLIPSVSWIFDHYGKRSFLVGSDYIFPHVANEILTHEITNLGGTVVGVNYIPLGSKDVDTTIQEIIAANPDVIFNTINGSTNVAFIKKWYAAISQLKQKRPPIMSFSLSIGDMNAIGLEKMIGDFSTWSYDHNQTLKKNQEFLDSYRQKYGSADEVNDPAAIAYSGVYLWAEATAHAPSVEPGVVREFILGRSVASPAGVLYVDPENANAWRVVFISKINEDKKNSIVWTSHDPIEPIVYPDFKSKAEWHLFEYQLYSKWNDSWGSSSK